jgi:tetraacyldisaccharide 4'-kinase
VRALLGWPVSAASRLRRAAYARGFWRATRLAGPVISVGNLSMGGRGKTPVVARVCELLREERLAVSVLSRGYKGRFRGDCLFVSDGERVTAPAALAGDEPVMLAHQLPGVVVAVGRERGLVGQAVELRFGERVHVLDDGFQHLSLHRDLDLVCVDARDLLDAPVPGGRLREPLSALARADLVLLSGTDAGGGAGVAVLEEYVGREHILRWGRRVLGFVSRDGAAHPPPRKPFLLAAIAAPNRFLADAKAECGEVAGTSFFRDHHTFTTRELAAVALRAKRAGADALVTTSKDEVRLPERLDLGLPVLVLRIAAAIEDEPRLRDRLRAAVGRAA